MSTNPVRVPLTEDGAPLLLYAGIMLVQPELQLQLELSFYVTLDPVQLISVEGQSQISWQFTNLLCYIMNDFNSNLSKIIQCHLVARTCVHVHIYVCVTACMWVWDHWLLMPMCVRTSLPAAEPDSVYLYLLQCCCAHNSAVTARHRAEPCWALP